MNCSLHISCIILPPSAHTHGAILTRNFRPQRRALNHLLILRKLGSPPMNIDDFAVLKGKCHSSLLEPNSCTCTRFSCIYIATVPIHFVLCSCGCSRNLRIDSPSLFHVPMLVSFQVVSCFSEFSIFLTHRGFPKIGVPPVLIHFHGYKPSIRGYPHDYGNLAAGPWQTPGSAQTRHERYLGFATFQGIFRDSFNKNG